MLLNSERNTLNIQAYINVLDIGIQILPSVVSIVKTNYCAVCKKKKMILIDGGLCPRQCLRGPL